MRLYLDMRLYLVYLETNISEEDHESTVIAVFDHEEEADDYCNICRIRAKENGDFNSLYYYTTLVLNEKSQYVRWYKKLNM